MEKILKKYTRIPEHLYIERDADEQLKRIVQEMERPGYVLVARQMGKTNLLFNAKRTLENKDRLFVYVDLSNTFKNEIDCYRNIIDTIIEPNEDFFEPISNEIFEIRKRNLPAHKEYSNSLKIILNYVQGNLVIILDEIDALRTTEYSDHIFAQIRSNYFSRTNFPVFNRLTYILSGVIEPADLIKDRNKSPFNIGDKIYLDDFTLEEHNLFVKKSKLNISQNISEEVFSWASGNPRLTFDIFSEIEDHIAMKKDITKELISNIIKNKYLTNFDIAPVDHIRELVKTHSSIRNAVYNIQIGIDEIDDETKRELYLYGIIHSNFNKKTKIKNKIIKEVLSIKWLDSINKQSNLTVTYGLAQIENREFGNAIQTFTKLLETKLSQKNTEVSNYFLGFAFYSLRNFEKAIECFSKKYDDKDYKRKSLSLLGTCKLGLGIDGGIPIFEEIIKVETNDSAYHNALLNLAINLPKTENERALSLYEKLYNSTFKSQETNEDDINQLRTLALYYQFEIYLEKQNRIIALEKLKEAKKYANKSDSLHLIYLEYSLTDEENKNEHLKTELIDIIVDNKLSFDLNNSYPISFVKAHLYHYIVFIYNETNQTLFNKIVGYSQQNLFNNLKNEDEIIYEASRMDDNKQISLLNYILKRNNVKENSLLLKIYRDLSFNYYSEQNLAYSKSFGKYLELVQQSSQILELDIYLFALEIKNNSDSGKINEGLVLCRIIEEKILQQADENLNFEVVMIYYWYATLYFSKKDNQSAIFYAKTTLELIKNSNKSKGSMIDEKGIKAISEQMLQIQSSAISRIPLVKMKKYGRNEKVKVEYSDGSVKESKYKNLEADILAERCKII